MKISCYSYVTPILKILTSKKNKMKTQDKRKQLRNIIDNALQKWNADELLVMLYESAKGNDADYLRNKMIDLTTSKGGVYIPCQTLEQVVKAEEFCASLFPHYNEQMELLNFSL